MEATEDVVKTKVCSKCGKSFPATCEFFNNDKSKPTGLRPDCKSCSSKNYATYAKDNKEKLRKSAAAYYIKNKDRINSTGKKYYRANVDAVKLKHKEWRDKNRRQPKHKDTAVGIVRVCEACGIEFSGKRSGTKYCSVECKNQGLKKDKVVLKCYYCGCQYEVAASTECWSKKRGHKHNFCKKECQTSFYVGENSSLWIEDRSKIKDQDKSARWSKQMVDWRKGVYSRDNHTCVMCGNMSSPGNPVFLNAHHIKTFSKHPDLRFELSNGVSLCEVCHRKTYKKEESFEPLFNAYTNHKEVHKQDGCKYHELRCDAVKADIT